MRPEQKQNNSNFRGSLAAGGVVNLAVRLGASPPQEICAAPIARWSDASLQTQMTAPRGCASLRIRRVQNARPALKAQLRLALPGLIRRPSLSALLAAIVPYTARLIRSRLQVRLRVERPAFHLARIFDPSTRRQSRLWQACLLVSPAGHAAQTCLADRIRLRRMRDYAWPLPTASMRRSTSGPLI